MHHETPALRNRLNRSTRVTRPARPTATRRSTFERPDLLPSDFRRTLTWQQEARRRARTIQHTTTASTAR
ncbi:hypothetical protein, partial [Clavibacter michiganensis]